MRITTSLTQDEIRACLGIQQGLGNITPDIQFVEFLQDVEATGPIFKYFVRIGTTDAKSSPDKLRRGIMQHTNNGRFYAASYDEWGFFLSELFFRDVHAKAGPYKNSYDFHTKTKDKFR